jgi:hypothetical protein
MIVDSPGMIDSPMVKDPFGTGKQAVMDRGYDFENVCKWYTFPLFRIHIAKE